MHIVVINPISGKVEEARVFDTYSSSEAFEAFIDKDMGDMEEGTIVVAACWDDCTKALSLPVKCWFADMGSVHIMDLKYREGFAFIGVLGRMWAQDVKKMDGPATLTRVYTIDDSINDDPEKWKHQKEGSRIELATFGAGCFWGTEKFFAKDFA